MTSSSRLHRATLSAASTVLLVLLLACMDSATAPVMPNAPLFAKGGGTTSGPSVTAVSPAFGQQGATGQQVTITGSGFTAGATPSWERGGVASTKIVVRDPRVISSTQIVATIDIAPDADLAFYDIAVYTLDRKKGIGTEMFEVTTAESIGSLGGNTVANGGNDSGDIVGYTIVSNAQRAFHWSATTGEMKDIGGAAAYGIDQAATTIVGVGGGQPLVWTRPNGSWVSEVLPMDPTASGGGANAVASDPLTGEASIIGGSENFSPKHATLSTPRLWRRVEGGWEKVVLPMPFAEVSGTYSWVAAVNANGQASGAVRRGGAAAQAVVWELVGGQYQSEVIGDGGGYAINSTGTIVVGFNNNGAALYYKRDGAGWSAPNVLPGGCGAAMGIDDSDRIVAHNCPIPGSSRVTSAVFYPPDYTSYVLLGGLGDRTEGGKAFGISRGGSVVFGTAPTKPTRVAVIWQSGF